MRRVLAVALPMGLVVAVGCQKRPTVVTARELLARPSRHDGERVVIAGIVQNPRNRQPAEGPGYTSFVLADGTDRVPVIAWGTAPVDSGDAVEVRGVFRAQMALGGDVVHDVVEGAFVRPFRKAPQPPGTPAGPP